MEDLLASTKKQVEYYLSNENMRHDAFFQKLIRANPDGWLDLTHILACPKMKQLKVTAANIVEALKDSILETKVEGEKSFVRRVDPLPDLVPRDSFKKADNKLSSDSAHAGGMVCVVRGVPEELNWQHVKEAFNELSNGDNTQAKKAKRVSFANKPNEKNEMVMVFNPFDNDLAWAKTAEVELNGAKLRLEILYGEDLKAALKVVPPHVVLQRQKNATFKKRKDNKIKLGGVMFQSVTDLKARVKNILAKSSPGTELAPASVEFAIVQSLLEYHPKKDQKLKGLKGIKVDKTDVNGQQSTCFFVVKEDGSSEDFSVNKCLEEVSRNPPIVVAGGHVKQDAAPASADASPSKKRKLEEAKSPSNRASTQSSVPAAPSEARSPVRSPALSPASKKAKVEGMTTRSRSPSKSPRKL